MTATTARPARHRTRMAGAATIVVLAGAPVLALAGPASAAGQVSAQDRSFLVTAHQSNLAEIASGQLAQQKATGEDIKAEGQLWIRQHTALDQSGAALATTYGVDLPTTPNATQQQVAAGQQARTGSAFDQYWISTGATGHAKTLAAVRAEIAQGSNPEFVAAARTAEPIVAGHLNDLEGLAATYDVALPSSVTAGTGGQAAAKAAGPGAALGVPLAAAGLAAVGLGAWTYLRRRTSPV